MNRREFVRLAGSGLPAAALAEAVVEAHVAQSRPPASAVPRRTLMKVGTPHGDTEEILKACAAFGVNNICSSLPSNKLDDKWSVDGLSRLRDRVSAHGIALDMVPLPMSSSEISTAEMPAIGDSTWQRRLQVQRGEGEAGAAADNRRQSRRGHVLGAHHLFPGAGRAGGGRV